MSGQSFEELLRRMPAIAEAVNAFASDTLQQRAFEALLAAFRGESSPVASPSVASPSAGSTTVGSQPAGRPNRPAEGGGLSTAQILAQARAGKSAGAAAAGAKAAPRAEISAESAAAAAASHSTDELPLLPGSLAKGAEGLAERSPVEEIKENSNHLAGPIAAELRDDTDHFGKESVQLVKHHGFYQQDDRDHRTATDGGKSKKSFIFMVRSKIPGGRMTADQLLAHLELCDEVGNTTLRITSRQGLQLHGVVKRDLPRVIGRINEVQLSTLGACGDVNRNVMAPSAPYKNAVYDELNALCDRLAAHFAPRSSAYHDIWLTDLSTGEKQLISGGENGASVEPIYGRVYLPRKFKMGVCLPEDNSVDVYAYDLGFMALHRDGRVYGYNVIAGGGQGVTPSNKKTFPALGHKFAFVEPDRAVDVAEAVIKVFRDYGDRADRKHARLKYVLAAWGVERFKSKVEEYYGGPLAPPTADEVHGFNDCLGWDEQGDGRWFYGLNVENGRIKDDERMQLKTAIGEICRELRPNIRLTAHQSLVFTDIAADDRGRLEEMLRRHGVKLSDEISQVRRWSMACVAWPTCGLSITESERALPGIVDQLETELARLGLDAEQFTVRMTGCPNGCARPYNCDVGLVGRSADKYTVFLGGRLLGNRLNFLYKDYVPGEEIVATLVPVFAYFKQERAAGESFGDFCQRKGAADLAAWAEQYLAVAQ